MTYLLIKRLIDIIVSAVALLILWPLFVFIACLICLETPGSPVFMQKRIGRNCRVFTIAKFRSMVHNASQIGSWSTSSGDPRITRLGKYLRMTSLDELPQLWNVLTGDMSLIGPRPDAPQQETDYTPADWQARHRFRPGITGLAQVNGRSNNTPEQRLHYDLAYTPSFSMDKEILLKTIRILLSKAGAN